MPDWFFSENGFFYSRNKCHKMLCCQVFRYCKYLHSIWIPCKFQLFAQFQYLNTFTKYLSQCCYNTSHLPCSGRHRMSRYVAGPRAKQWADPSDRSCLTICESLSMRECPKQGNQTRSDGSWSWRTRRWQFARDHWTEYRLSMDTTCQTTIIYKSLLVNMPEQTTDRGQNIQRTKSLPWSQLKQTRHKTEIQNLNATTHNTNEMSK